MGVSESFSKFSNVLIAPIMAALLFGVTINRKKIMGFLDYICVEQAVYGIQICLGAGFGARLAVVWPGLPTGWGSMEQFAFQGGHGSASAAGATYTDLGVPENLSIGMVLATFGLIVAMLVGMIIVNIGVRRGWTKFVKDPKGQPDDFYGGALPEERRSPIGKTVTTSISINHLALQGVWLLTAVFCGKGLFGRGSPSVCKTEEKGVMGLKTTEHFNKYKLIWRLSLWDGKSYCPRKSWTRAASCWRTPDTPLSWAGGRDGGRAGRRSL